MTLEEISALNGAELLHAAGLPDPDPAAEIASSGTQYLSEVRGSFVADYAIIRASDYPQDTIAGMAGDMPDCYQLSSTARWRAFTALQLWNEGSGDMRCFNRICWDDLTSTVTNALSGIAERLMYALWVRLADERASEDEV